MEGTFCGCTSFRLEIVAAEVIGDIASTVAYEHTEAIVNGESRVYSLRATRSTGARMASGRSFIATEAPYRNACHDPSGDFGVRAAAAMRSGR
jgi:hypothetical protein